MKPKLIIFASGSATGGGSGFAKLCEAVQNGVLDADIVAVVSNHENGGVRSHAETFGIPFVHFKAPYTAEAYQKIIADHGAEWVSLSGWLKLVKGLDPTRTFNIHPGPLPTFGGAGMYGDHVHEAVLAAYKRGEMTHSAVSMHFVTPEFDEGPVFFSMLVPIFPDDTVEKLRKRVNQAEHVHQARITNLVIHGMISWDGKAVIGAILNRPAIL